MTTREMAAPTSGGKKTMRGVVFSVLLAGQKAKHENELRRMGFEVDTRDFPKTYNLNAYDVVFLVKDFADTGEKNNATDAAKLAGKPWFWLTKKVSNPTWEAVREFAKKQGLTPVGDVNSHEPTFTARPFAEHLANYMEKKTDAEEWEELAKQYDAQAKAEKQRADDACRVEQALRQEIERLKVEAERPKEAPVLREEVLRLEKELAAAQKELQTLTTARATGRKAASEDLQRRLADTDTLMRQARAERDEVKKDLAAAQKVVKGLQDEIDKLTKQVSTLNTALAAKPPMVMSTPIAAPIPAGKKLVPANIVQTADKLWALFEDDVLDIEEAWSKLVTQLKGDDDE